MKYYAYIFVERNMGSGYAFAYPRLSPLRGWFFRKFILPVASMELTRQEATLRGYEELTAALVAGVAVYSERFKYTVYKRKIMPDTACPDPRAEGRNPRFEMYVVFSGSPNVFSKQFNEFQEKCNQIAWQTLLPGERDELTVEVPEELYPPKEQ